MNRIAQLRKELKMSQAELAKELGLHQTAISQWENGRTAPSFEALNYMSDLFDVSLHYLMGSSSERGRGRFTEEDAEILGKMEVADYFAQFLEAFKSLDEFGRAAVEAVLAVERRRMARERKED